MRWNMEATTTTTTTTTTTRTATTKKTTTRLPSPTPTSLLKWHCSAGDRRAPRRAKKRPCRLKRSTSARAPRAPSERTARRFHDALDSSFASTYTLLVRDKASYYVVGSHAILHAQMKDGDGNPCEPLQMREDVFLCSNRDRNAVCKSYVAEKGYSEVAQTVIVMSLHGKSDERGRDWPPTFQ